MTSRKHPLIRANSGRGARRRNASGRLFSSRSIDYKMRNRPTLLRLNSAQSLSDQYQVKTAQSAVLACIGAYNHCSAAYNYRRIHVKRPYTRRIARTSPAIGHNMLCWAPTYAVCWSTCLSASAVGYGY